MPSGTQHLLTCSTNIAIVIIAVTTATSVIWLLLCSKHCTKHFVDRSSFIAHETLWIEMIAPSVEDAGAQGDDASCARSHNKQVADQSFSQDGVWSKHIRILYHLPPHPSWTVLLLSQHV